MRSHLVVFILPFIATATPAAAQSDVPNQALVALRNEMQALNRVGWKVLRAAGDTCPAQAAGIGLTIDFAGAYGSAMADSLKQTWAMGDLPQVAAVAPDSPAATAGIAVGDEILAVNGTSTPAMIKASADPSLFADQLEEYLARQAPGQPISIMLRRSKNERIVPLTPVSVCASRFVYKLAAQVDAYTDSTTRNVGVTSGLIAFARTDDQLALIVAHELGHVIRRDPKGGGWNKVRAMEDRADTVGAALIRCAGYDIRAGAEFFLDYHRRDLLRWFRSPSHRNMKDRAVRVLATPETACPLDATGLAALEKAR